MDMRSRGISWVGNIYQKLEAMCEEVDGFIGQEKAKYQRNQIQGGCDSVGRFRTGVVQDLLPHPSESNAKQPTSELLKPPNSEVKVRSEEDLSLDFLLYESPNRKNEGSLLRTSESNVKQSASEALMSAKSELIVPLAEDLALTPSFNESQNLSIEEACDKLNLNSMSVSVECAINSDSEIAPLDDENVSDAIAGICETSKTKPYELNRGLSSCVPCVMSTDEAVECAINNDSELDDEIVSDAIADICETSSTQPGELNGRGISNCVISTDESGTISRVTLPLVESPRYGYGKHGETSSEYCLPPEEIVALPDRSPEYRTSRDSFAAEDFMGALCDVDWQEAPSTSSATEICARMTEEFEDVKLDDDRYVCPDVDLLQDEICFIYQQAKKKKSYKKRLQDAIASKLRAKKKESIEQIAVWYANAEGRQRPGELSKFSADDQLKRQSTSDSYDSDWELL